MIDYYWFTSRLLRSVDPETAQKWALRFAPYVPSEERVALPALRVDAAGISFPNPIGLAAGFDKDAIAAAALFKLGLGFVEVGTVTPRPQEGNPKPRVFRLSRDAAVINRFGFPSVGLARFKLNLRRQYALAKIRGGIIGVNIGANTDSKDRAADYEKCLRVLYRHGDYFAINVSSPNTPGLRDLQIGSALRSLLDRLAMLRGRLEIIRGRKPIFLKIAPDLAPDEIRSVAQAAIEFGIDGLIVGNTSIQRPNLLSDEARERGGLSGKPIYQLSTEALSNAYKEARGRLILIGVGGVSTPQDVYGKIRAGATLVQLYTALAYEGPRLIPRLLKGLAECLSKDGFASMVDAVGAAHSPSLDRTPKSIIRPSGSARLAAAE